MGLDRVPCRRELIFPGQSLTLGSYDGKVELRKKVNADSEKTIKEMREKEMDSYNGKVTNHEYFRMIRLGGIEADKVLKEIQGGAIPLENILAENCSIKP